MSMFYVIIAPSLLSSSLHAVFSAWDVVWSREVCRRNVESNLGLGRLADFAAHFLGGISWLYVQSMVRNSPIVSITLIGVVLP